MSLRIAKLSSRSLAIASAALVIHVGAATAADSKVDIQQQTKESLVGSTRAHYAPQSGPRHGEVANPTPDAPELARQLLLGTNRFRVASDDSKPNAAGTAGETQPRQPVAYGDAQAAAQELLLGQHHANHAWATANTEPEKRPVANGDAQAAAQQLLLGEHRVSAPSSRAARAKS